MKKWIKFVIEILITLVEIINDPKENVGRSQQK